LISVHTSPPHHQNFTTQTEKRKKIIYLFTLVYKAPPNNHHITSQKNTQMEWEKIIPPITSYKKSLHQKFLPLHEKEKKA